MGWTRRPAPHGLLVSGPLSPRAAHASGDWFPQSRATPLHRTAHATGIPASPPRQCPAAPPFGCHLIRPCVHAPFGVGCPLLRRSTTCVARVSTASVPLATVAGAPPPPCADKQHPDKKLSRSALPSRLAAALPHSLHALLARRRDTGRHSGAAPHARPAF
jgi:hypothetical protein